jgi:hypothetical protein
MLRHMLVSLLAALLILAGCPKPGGWGDAPDFSYTQSDGAQAKLSNLAGKVTVVNFWAVW